MNATFIGGINSKVGILAAIIISICSSFFACTKPVESKMLEQNELTTYDSSLAAQLEADQYGMHQYVIAFLKKGQNRTLDSAKAVELQRAHMTNIRRLADEGKLILAGPFLDTGELRGIYIFDVKTVEEAMELTKTDPAIQAGSLVMELKPWYGSAALMSVQEIHEKIAKESP
jgi:uncharacterized protein